MKDIKWKLTKKMLNSSNEPKDDIVAFVFLQ